MKHTYTVILAILLVIALAIPAFASSYSTYDLQGTWKAPETLTPFTFDIPETSWLEVNLEIGYWRTDTGEQIISSGLAFHEDGHVAFMKDLGQDAWLYNSGKLTNAVQNGVFEIYSIPGTVPEGFVEWFMLNFNLPCDGTSCPANDVDHNNICDDCGKPLPMSLRSTLLDYAKAQAESWGSTWPYYSVVSDGVNDDRYMVYMSNQAQVADAETGKIVTSPNGMNRFEVTTEQDGTFVASGNYGATEWSGELVYANHNIENFRVPPLAVIIQGVTGEALEVTLPSLHQTITTIVLCGVGCLALLILLHLLGKKSQIFHL